MKKTDRPHISIQDALKKGWDLTQANASVLVWIILTAFVFLFGPPILVSVLRQMDRQLVASFVNILGVVVTTIISIGLIRITLDLHDKQKVEFDDLYSGGRHFINYFITSFGVSIISVLGMFLLIVPGIIWGIRFQYATTLVVDEGLQPIEALQKSWQITKGHTWKLFLFAAVTTLMSVVGLLLVGIGFLVIWPVILLANISIYRKLNA